MLYAIAIGVIFGFAVGGRPNGLGDIRFHWAPLALAGLVCQLALFSPPVTAIIGALGPSLYVASTLIVLMVVVRNVRVAPGLALVAAGAVSNLAAITANGGFMPATQEAVMAAGRAAAVGYSNSVELARPALESLVDRYATPAWLPFANVFSIGDVLIGAGIVLVIVAGMARARPDGSIIARPAARVRLQGLLPRPGRQQDRVPALPGAPGTAGSDLGSTPGQGARLLWTRSPRLRVLAFSTVLASAGVIGFGLLAPRLTPTQAPLSIPWPLFAVAYYIAEVKVIDVHFRRETHSFSLSELPIVLGLFFVEPRTYVLGILLGATAALITAHEPPSKILFNLSYFLVGAVTGLALFQAIAPRVGSLSPLDCVAAFAATVAMSGIGAMAIATVITLSGGAPQFERLPQMVQAGGLFAVTNTSIALLAVDILWNDPQAIWLIAVPVVTLFLAYRAYLSERQKHENLELLYESSRIFQRSPELGSAILAMLEHARIMFRVDRAEVVVHGSNDSEPLRTTAGPGTASEVMVPSSDRAEILAHLAADPTPFIYVPGADLPLAADRLFRFAMVSPLRGESGLLGAMLVADRIDDSDEFRPDELRMLETVANQTAVALENGQLEQSLAELSRLKEELRHQAYHDPLTGLANRALFLQSLEERLTGQDDQPLPVVLFLDLDDFKVINDTVGHTVGDALLQAVAGRIQGCIRGDDMAVRLGGDEFAVLLSDSPDLRQAIGIADRITEALRAPFRLGGREFAISASIGIASGSGGQRAGDILRNADVAMYAAKGRGKGQLAVWDPEMHAAIIERHELSSDLSRAIVRDELAVYYQPLVALGSGNVVGFEALARWNHPTRGPVPPDAFIALAEESGAIVSLGRRVLQRACEQAVEWGRSPGLGPLTMSVNISPHQVQRKEFIADVRSILAETGLDPRQLILEMTETAMFRDMDGAIRKLQNLRRTGIRLAVDDFGTGYSSLRYLRQFPVDDLKIAKEFVSAASDDDWAIARAIVALGRALGVTIIAEGIETARQRDLLRELGCQIGQGYLFSRALPAEDVPSFVGRLNPAASGDGSSWLNAVVTERSALEAPNTFVA